MSPARRLLYKRPVRCVFASNIRGAREKILTFGVNDFPFSLRIISFSSRRFRGEYTSKRLNTMRLRRYPVFVVKLAVW